jgi:exopolysaccharide biosynthesis polyprenyl glycosylphosphotransferase
VETLTSLREQIDVSVATRTGGHPQSAAGRRARVGGRTARREVAADVFMLGTLAVIAWQVAPALRTPVFTLRSAALLVLVTLTFYAGSSVFATVQRPNPPLLDEAKRIAFATVGAIAVWFLLSAYFVDQIVDRRLGNLLMGWVAGATVSSLLVQRVTRALTRRANPERVLIIGAGAIGQTVARKVHANAGRRGRVVGFYDQHPYPLHPSLEETPIFEETQPLASVIEQTRATRLMIAFSHLSADEVLDTIRNSRFGAIPVSIVPRYFELTPTHARLSDFDGLPVLDLHSARLSRGARLAKRALDTSLAWVGLVCLSPVFLAIAVAVKLTSQGPIFFGQVRTGQNAANFRMWKFRTMVHDAEHRRHELAHLNDMNGSGPLFKMRADPRVTPVGRILRRFSLDELPQLWNVVNGTMSLVGPRPFVGHEAEKMDGWSLRRLDLAPGITGLWQVRGRNDVPYNEMIRLDYLYVTTWSIWWDLRILLQTIPLVLRGRGAS